MKNACDILIVGGGLNGPALALALAQTGHSVTVVDSLTPDKLADEAFDGRGYALALASQRLLQQIGVWQHLSDANAQPMLEIKVTDGHASQGPSPFFIHFDHAELEEGPMGYMAEDRLPAPRPPAGDGGCAGGHAWCSGRTVVDTGAGPHRRDRHAG